MKNIIEEYVQTSLTSQLTTLSPLPVHKKKLHNFLLFVVNIRLSIFITHSCQIQPINKTPQTRTNVKNFLDVDFLLLLQFKYIKTEIKTLYL